MTSRMRHVEVEARSRWAVTVTVTDVVKGTRELTAPSSPLVLEPLPSPSEPTPVRRAIPPIHLLYPPLPHFFTSSPCVPMSLTNLTAAPALPALPAQPVPVSRFVGRVDYDLDNLNPRSRAFGLVGNTSRHLIDHCVVPDLTALGISPVHFATVYDRRKGQVLCYWKVEENVGSSRT